MPSNANSEWEKERRQCCCLCASACLVCVVPVFVTCLLCTSARGKEGERERTGLQRQEQQQQQPRHDNGHFLAQFGLFPRRVPINEQLISSADRASCGLCATARGHHHHHHHHHCQCHHARTGTLSVWYMHAISHIAARQGKGQGHRMQQAGRQKHSQSVCPLLSFLAICSRVQPVDSVKCKAK